MRALGHQHVAARTRAELAAALGEPTGIRVVEVRTSRTDLAQTLSRMTEAVRAAV